MDARPPGGCFPALPEHTWVWKGGDETRFHVPLEAGLAPLRYHYRDPNDAKPFGVDMTGTFTDKIQITQKWACARCQVNARLPALMESLDAALQSTSGLIRSLQKEGAKLYGNEGVNAGMQRALRAMNVCFNWEKRLSERRPGKRPDCITEFGELCNMLRPLLRQTYYPRPEEFPEVRHAWPDVEATPIPPCLSPHLYRVQTPGSTVMQTLYQHHTTIIPALYRTLCCAFIMPRLLVCMIPALCHHAIMMTKSVQNAQGLQISCAAQGPTPLDSYPMASGH